MPRASSCKRVLLMSVFLYFQTPNSFPPYVAPSFPIYVGQRFVRVFFFLQNLVVLCERERVQAAQSAGVGHREGVSARGTVSNAGAVRRRAPQLQQASARQASASQMLLMRVAACRRRAVSSLLHRHRRRVRPRASKEPTWVDSEEMRRTNSSPNTRRSTPADGLAATRGERYRVTSKRVSRLIPQSRD